MAKWIVTATGIGAEGKYVRDKFVFTSDAFVVDEKGNLVGYSEDLNDVWAVSVWEFVERVIEEKTDG